MGGAALLDLSLAAPRRSTVSRNSPRFLATSYTGLYLAMPIGIGNPLKQIA